MKVLNKSLKIQKNHLRKRLTNIFMKMIYLISNRIVVKIALLNFNLILLYMKRPIILATFTMIAIWWIAIYRFGWWGAVGCLTFGIITTLLIEWKR